MSPFTDVMFIRGFWKTGLRVVESRIIECQCYGRMMDGIDWRLWNAEVKLKP